MIIGNSLSAVMNGNVNITLLSRGETYVLSLPYAHCKGLILGTLTMELGGIVTIKCDRTGYSAQIEFKLKVMLVNFFKHVFNMFNLFNMFH